MSWRSDPILNICWLVKSSRKGQVFVVKKISGGEPLVGSAVASNGLPSPEHYYHKVIDRGI